MIGFIAFGVILVALVGYWLSDSGSSDRCFTVCRNCPFLGLPNACPKYHG